MNRKYIRIIPAMILASALITTLSSCEKEEGYGGTCTLTGKVFVQDFNGLGQLQREYYAPDERVFIVYGDEPVYGDEMRTHHDGTFRFEHLYKGKYSVYAYSECDTCDVPDVPVQATVEFTREKEEIVTADIVVIK